MVSKAPDNGGGVGVAESLEPAAADQDTREAPLRGLAQRMAAVRAESYGIGKQDIKMKNKEGTKEWMIKSHTVEAVLSEIRPLLEKHGVGLTPALTDYKLNGNLCVATFDFEFMDLETGEARVISWAGAGTDNSDKALAKAGTNALKELLKKVFLITDRDDAKEEEEAVQHQAEGSINRADLDAAKEAARAHLEKWATAARAAFLSAATLDDVKALEREHKDQLTSAEMPAATRAFFAQLIADRKEELA